MQKYVRRLPSLKISPYFIIFAYWFLIPGIAVELFPGCGSRLAKLRPATPPQEKFDQAKALFDKKKYFPAIEAFKSFIFEHPGTEMIDRAIYYLAESYYFTKDYLLAENEYRNLLRDFPYPRSLFSIETQFKLGLAIYKQSLPAELDQAKTQEAEAEFHSFVETYPDHPLASKAQTMIEDCKSKLATKDLKNGLLYFRMHDYSAALLYFEDVIENFPESKISLEAQYFKGFCFFQQKRWGDARTVFLNLKSQDYNRLGNYKNKIEEFLFTLQKKQIE